MSLKDLQATLQGQRDHDGTITVSAATLTQSRLTPAPDFDKTIQASLCLANPLQIKTDAIPAPSDKTLTIKGTASFLTPSEIAVEVVFTLGKNNVVDVLIAGTLPPQWKFATSFPVLVGYPFDDLSISQPCYLLATSDVASHVWSSKYPPLLLKKGLNFASVLTLGGPLGILQGFIDALGEGDTVVFAGTIDPAGAKSPAIAQPAVALAGIVDRKITANTSFDLSLPQVLLTSTSDETAGVAYWLAFSSTLSVNKKPFCTFQTGILKDSTSFGFSMRAAKNPITAEDIIGLIGGVDFQKETPKPLAGFFSIGLKELGATIGVKPMNVAMLSCSIGTTKTYPIGEFELESLALNCTVTSPFVRERKSISTTVTATAAIFKEVFTGDFEFEIFADGDALTIGAGYSGTVSLNKLIAGLSHNAITIPKSVADITFSDFGLSVTKLPAGCDWQLYGSAEAAFSLGLSTGPLDATFSVLVQSTGGQRAYQLAGGLKIGEEYFDAKLELDATSRYLTASWHSIGRPLEMKDVAKAFGWTMPDIPSSLDLGLTGAALTYDFGVDESQGGSLAFGAQSKNYGNVAFVTLMVGKKREYFFLLATGQTIELSNLPLVGHALAKIETVAVSDFQIVISSMTSVDATVVGEVNSVIAQLNGQYPTLPSAGTKGMVIASAIMQFGKDAYPLNISLGGPASAAQIARPAVPNAIVPAASPGAALVLATVSASEPADDGITWFTVQKSFGPVSIERIGVMYQSAQQTLWFELHATLAFGPLSLSLVGLGIGSPLTHFKPRFSLSGLGVSYSKPPLEIAGALINLAPPGADYIEFEGGITIATSKLTLEAFGYYGNRNGFSSMFIFGDLSYPFGGPPAFFLTGVALGFGYNSALRIPSIDEVQSFPFVQVLPTATRPNTNLFGPNPTPVSVLDVIRNTVPPWVSATAGSLWFGAGITFTSFELVNSQAMILVEAGEELVIALVGSSRAQFPQGETQKLYANIELDFEVRFAPAEGVFSAQAVLASGSFLLDQACVLTGGFAFFVWYDPNPHAGDFVLTLGGYNPGFKPPSHYPVVPIVGFNWTLDASISITGGAYFALTPAVMMAGGRLDATYQSGNLKAWFDAHADIIIRWKPFWFDASIGITIGASYRIDLLITTATISVELGCDLELWGPPTGGTVTVNLYIVSFTVHFGKPKSDAQAVKSWADVEAMLPNSSASANRNVLSATPVSGLMPTGQSPKKVKRPEATLAAVADSANPPWRVRGGEFVFTAATPVPAVSASVGATHAFQGSPSIDVHPLGLTGVSSTFAVAITDAAKRDVSGTFDVALMRGPVPASLWGKPATDPTKPPVPTSNALLVGDQITGVQVAVKPSRIGATAGAVDVAGALAFVELPTQGDLPFPDGPPAIGVPVNTGKVISTIADTKTGIGAQTVATARGGVLTALGTLGYAPTTRNDPMLRFAAAGGAFAQEPLLAA